MKLLLRTMAGNKWPNSEVYIQRYNLNAIGACTASACPYLLINKAFVRLVVKIAYGLCKCGVSREKCSLGCGLRNLWGGERASGNLKRRWESCSGEMGIGHISKKSKKVMKIRIFQLFKSILSGIICNFTFTSKCPPRRPWILAMIPSYGTAWQVGNLCCSGIWKP